MYGCNNTQISSSMDITITIVNVMTALHCLSAWPCTCVRLPIHQWIDAYMIHIVCTCNCLLSIV